VELNVVAYGQWNLARPADKERMEVAPPLREDNILTTQQIHHVELKSPSFPDILLEREL
jgi:hypothetical protein